jgi:hypothetical protein
MDNPFGDLLSISFLTVCLDSLDQGMGVSFCAVCIFSFFQTDAEQRIRSSLLIVLAH